jgi:hypothetical protein
MNYSFVFCWFLCNLFDVHVGTGLQKGKGTKEDSPLLFGKKTKQITAKKQKISHDPRSSSIGSSLPPSEGPSPGSPGNWIESDCNFATMFFGF